MECRSGTFMVQWYIEFTQCLAVQKSQAYITVHVCNYTFCLCVCVCV